MRAFWDHRFEYGNPYRLWALDKLHHIDLGIAKRLGVDQLKVRQLPVAGALYRSRQLTNRNQIDTTEWIISQPLMANHTEGLGRQNFDELVQAILKKATERSGSKLTIQGAVQETNAMYTIAREMTIAPFPAPPHARKGEIVNTASQVAYGKLKASEVGRLLRTLPHIVEAFRGCQNMHVTSGLIKCDSYQYGLRCQDV